jgi:glycosyltransferase involved in cell wall biosynthesis
MVQGMMRILILTNKLPYPPKDGGSIATLNMITGLRDAGNLITCLALNTSKHSYPVGRIPEELAGSIRFLAVPCDSSIKPVRMLLNLVLSSKPYIAERFRNRAYRDTLARLLEREQFDLIQLEGPYPGHYLDLIRASSDAVISFRAHNVEHLIWKRKAANERSILKRWYLSNMAARLKRYEMDVVAGCDCLVAISAPDEASFRENGSRQPSLVIPAGLSMSSYPETPLPAAPTVFFIGALDWLPNQEGLKWFLDHVFEPLLDDIPGIVLHVAGRNAPGHIEKLLGRDRIIYHGEVDSARNFIQSYRVMVAPLLTGSGIRIKILESMALCRPVVTTTIGIEGIPAENNREVLVADDPGSFKDQLVKLISDHPFAEEVVARGRKLVQENFDTFELSNRLNQFFKEQV